MKDFKVLIIDDHPIARSGLELALSTSDSVASYESVECGSQGLEKLEQGNFNLILLDINLPDMSGIDVLIQIVEKRDLTVVIVSGESRVVDFQYALSLGASGIVSKSDPIEHILKSLNASITHPYISPKIQSILGTSVEKPISLSPRQMAILHYLKQGETNKEISYRLGISAPTVSFHLKEIRYKLGVRGNKKILGRADELGLLDQLH